MTFPKPVEDLDQDRRAAETIAANVYLSAIELAMLWELERVERGALMKPEHVRALRAIKTHAPTHGERLVKIERMADLGLVTFKSTAAELTPWGRFVAGVRRGAHG